MSVNHDDLWRAHAACAGADTSKWFPERGEKGGCIEAQRVCSSCPVQVDCMNHALLHPERSGIWAGTGWDGRKVLRRLLADCPHPKGGARYGCECALCKAVEEHFTRLKVLAETGRGPSPARLTFGAGARHGTRSSYKRGCVGDDCREAMGMKRRGIPCQTSEEAKAG